ncbi:hypothetical protein SFRURICE_006277, partial [Spodoptera frugiperda]
RDTREQASSAPALVPATAARVRYSANGHGLIPPPTYHPDAVKRDVTNGEVLTADCGSRGLQPKELSEHTLWWRGPHWLSEPTVRTESKLIEDTHEERILIYKLKKDDRPKLPTSITLSEMNETLLAYIKQVQKREFFLEIKRIKTEECVSRKNKFRYLCPILDQKGILRVRGRIELSGACYDTKYPIIMPGNHHLTKLIIADAHENILHGGSQAIYKWNTKCDEPEIGGIVVLKGDNMPPAKWLLALLTCKIIKKYPGPDNITRVVSVKCKTGE